MKLLSYYLLTFLLISVSTLAYTQTVDTVLTGTFRITLSEEGTAFDYTIKGKFSDPNLKYTNVDVKVKDVILDADGNYFIIEVINSATSLSLSVDVTAANSPKVAPVVGYGGTLFRPTSNGYPILAVGLSTTLENLIQNTTTIKIDKDMPNGAQMGVSFPPNPIIGDVFFNTVDQKLYMFNSSAWVIITNSDNQTLSDILNNATSAGDKIISNLGDPIENQDAATKKYVDAKSIKSGVILPSNPLLADLFYNTTESKLYIFNGTGWILVGSGIMASGGSSEFPGSAKAGEMYYNTEDNSCYIFNGSKWLKISTNGSNPNGIINPDPATVNINEGNLFYNTSDHRLYVYNGSVWMPADNILPSGQMYVGNTTNTATPVSMSGDATINNSGKITIVKGAVNDEKLDKTNIPLSGFANPTDNVSLGDGTTNNRIINLSNPMSAQDAATKSYVDLLFANPTAMLTLPSGSFFIGNISNKAVAINKNAIALSGFGNAVSNVSLGDGTTNYKIINLANPIAAQDAATKSYVDTKTLDPYNIPLATDNFFVGNSSGKATSTLKSAIALSGFGTTLTDISFGNFKITNLANPTTDNDAATKIYVDSKSGSVPSGTTPPASPLPGNTFYNTTEKIYYVYDGTQWVPVDNALPYGQLYVGDASGKAAATLKSAIPLSGFGAATATISLGNFKISNLSDPATDQDAATKKYVDTKAAATQSGGTIPSTGQIGDTFYSTTDGRLYVYNGSSWVPVDNSLASGQLYVGNSAGVATATAKNAIPVSGFGAANADISMGSKHLTDLATPVSDADATTKAYVDAQIAAPGHGDNFGNHTASANVKMAAYRISSDGASGKGLSFDATGNATFDQNLTLNGNFYTPSDQRLKTKVETLSRVLQDIDRIRGVRFEYKDQKKYAVGSKIGVIAQELQRVYPEMVNKGSDGFLKVDYSQLTGVLIQAIKEQEQQIKQQQQQIDVLREHINNQQQQIDAILKKLQ